VKVRGAGERWGRDGLVCLRIPGKGEAGERQAGDGPEGRRGKEKEGDGWIDRGWWMTCESRVLSEAPTARMFFAVASIVHV
jgi:hypothetical protein